MFDLLRKSTTFFTLSWFGKDQHQQCWFTSNKLLDWVFLQISLPHFGNTLYSFKLSLSSQNSRCRDVPRDVVVVFAWRNFYVVDFFLIVNNIFFVILLSGKV